MSILQTKAVLCPILTGSYYSYSCLVVLWSRSVVSDSVRPHRQQAPLSPGFSRQEHWSGLPFPSPMHESEKTKWSLSVLSDSYRPHGLQPTRLLHPWDFPGKSTGVGCHCLLRVSGLFFSKKWDLFCLLKFQLSLLQLLLIGSVTTKCQTKWKWSCSVVSDSLRPHGLTVAYQAPPSMGFSSKSTGVGCHCLQTQLQVVEGMITGI